MTNIKKASLLSLFLSPNQRKDRGRMKVGSTEQFMLREQKEVHFILLCILQKRPFHIFNTSLDFPFLFPVRNGNKGESKMTQTRTEKFVHGQFYIRTTVYRERERGGRRGLLPTPILGFFVSSFFSS